MRFVNAGKAHASIPSRWTSLWSLHIMAKTPGLPALPRSVKWSERTRRHYQGPQSSSAVATPTFCPHRRSKTASACRPELSLLQIQHSELAPPSPIPFPARIPDLCGYGQTIDRSEFGQQSDESPSRDLQRLAGGLSIYTYTNGSLSRSRNRDRCRPGNGRWVVQDEIQLS